MISLTRLDRPLAFVHPAVCCHLLLANSVACAMVGLLPGKEDARFQISQVASLHNARRPYRFAGVLFCWPDRPAIAPQGRRGEGGAMPFLGADCQRVLILALSMQYHLAPTLTGTMAPSRSSPFGPIQFHLCNINRGANLPVLVGREADL